MACRGKRISHCGCSRGERGYFVTGRMQTNMDQNPTVAVSVSVTVVVVGREGVAVVAERYRDSEFAGPDDRKGKAVVHQAVVDCNLAAEDSCPSEKTGVADILWDLTGPLKLPELWDYVSPAAKGKSEFQTAGLTFKKMPF
jgi:hypothetical protein